MKYVKMLILAAVATAALMAFVGASSASATVLCKAEPTSAGTICPSGSAYGAGTRNHEVNVGVVKLDTGFKTIECKKSTIEGEIESEGSATETPKGPVRALTFEECNCEVKVLKNGTQEFHWITETKNGTLTSNGTEVTANCSTIFGNVHCIYVTNNGDTGEVTGGNPAITHVNESIERKTTNSLCDEESKWTGTYEVTSPKPLWFAAHT
jgi:type 1 fimbria pilin